MYHSTVRLAVNESGIYKWHDMVKGDIEFEGRRLVVTGSSKRKMDTQIYNFAVVDEPSYANLLHVIRETTILQYTKTAYGLWFPGWEAL